MAGTTPIALVTGGSRGLGRNMAEQIAASGTDVIVTYKSRKADADAVVAEIERGGRRAAALPLDAGDVKSFDGFAAQDALDLTRSLGGYVVSSSVATGEEGSAAITVRVPVAKVQDAITGLSDLGRIVSQQVSIEDLQAQLDELEQREAAVRGQIARIRARLATESLDAQTEAVLRAKLQTLRTELTELRSGISSTEAEARMSTIQLTVVTPGAFGAVAPPSMSASRLRTTPSQLPAGFCSRLR